ncbi:MAG: hemerythrin family protein [Candidatus Aureabacteria bacterium]|nr:hemerythrin family protein [Candidatus Auribacterota bacterium]
MVGFLKNGEKMAYIEWSDDFSVNVKEIDSQHRVLIDMINMLYEAFIAEKGKDVHKKVIDGMIDYARIHFETERKYMKQFNFPGYEEHNKEHEIFTQKAMELQKQFNAAGFILSSNILNFLKDWLKNHILGTDKKYSNHFNDNGLY